MLNYAREKDLALFLEMSKQPRPQKPDDLSMSIVIPAYKGHTDNVPIHTAQYPSNWELSTARATKLVKLFILRYHVMPSRLSAAGYAEFHPVNDNSTAENRAHNRRIDVVIPNPVLNEESSILSQSPSVNPLAGPANDKNTPSSGARSHGP
jgi:OmpA family protein